MLKMISGLVARVEERLRRAKMEAKRADDDYDRMKRWRASMAPLTARKFTRDGAGRRTR